MLPSGPGRASAVSHRPIRQVRSGGHRHWSEPAAAAA